MHEHEVMELVYHPSGEGISSLEDGTEIFYSDRSVVLYSARVPHDQTPSRPGADVCIHLNVPSKAADLFVNAAGALGLENEKTWVNENSLRQAGSHS